MPTQADLYGRGFVQATDPLSELLSSWFWPSRDAPVNMPALLALQAGGALLSTVDPALPGHSMTAETIKEGAEQLWAASLLDSATLKVQEPKARYAFLAQHPVGAALLVAKIPRGIDDSTTPSSVVWSDPVLLCLGVPSVTPQGGGLPPIVFPATGTGEPPSSLLPKEAFFPVALSAQADSRKEPAVVSADSYLRDVMLVFDGLRFSDVFAAPATTVADADTLQQESFAANLEKMWDALSTLMGRTDGSLGVLTPSGGAVDRDAFCCLLPRVLLLPQGFNLPVGQVWSPHIGLDGFLASFTILERPTLRFQTQKPVTMMRRLQSFSGMR